MLLYFGQIKNVNNSGGCGALPLAIQASREPIILSTITTAPEAFTQETISELSKLVGNINTSFWLRIRNHVTMANALAYMRSQMSTLQALCVGLQLEYFRGFVIDGSNNISALQGAIDYAHTLGKSVGIVLDDPWLLLSGNIKLAERPQYNDIVVHRSPLTVGNVWYDGVISPDMAKMSAVLQAMKMTGPRQYIVQEFPFEPAVVNDGAGNLQMTLTQMQIMRRAAYFFEVCGITEYAFCPDANMGRNSNGFLHRGIYEPFSVFSRDSAVEQPNPYGKASVFLDSDELRIYVKAVVSGSVVTLGIFSKELKPVLAVADPTHNIFADTFGFALNDSSADPITIVGAFGEDMSSGIMDPLQTPVMDMVDMTLAIRDIYAKLALVIEG